MKRLFTLATAALLFFSVTSLTNAQGKHGEIGKVFGKQEANVLFGKVIGSVQIKVSDLQKAIDRGGDYIYFMVKHSQLVVANERRESLRDDGEQIGKDEVMYVFSKSEVKKLLQAGVSSGSKEFDKKGTAASVAASTATDVVTAEVRASVLTLSYGDATLEMSTACPPAC
ncbi:MAG: hypothetical protein M1495_18325 [Bacteroidetes bacterium]|nr:hypothetical protein [Bacteroidota bacterium]